MYVFVTFFLKKGEIVPKPYPPLILIFNEFTVLKKLYKSTLTMQKRLN